jgi:hypothetical protein
VGHYAGEQNQRKKLKKTMALPSINSLPSVEGNTLQLDHNRNKTRNRNEYVQNQLNNDRRD